MSLDFYLYHHCVACTDARCTGVDGAVTVLDKNITHNLTGMWREAGVYEALYESDGLRARTVIPTLRLGLAAMEADPDRFKAFNAPNGWGLYKHALPWLREVYEACVKYPNAVIGVSR